MEGEIVNGRGGQRRDWHLEKNFISICFIGFNSMLHNVLNFPLVHNDFGNNMLRTVSMSLCRAVDFVDYLFDDYVELGGNVYVMFSLFFLLFSLLLFFYVCFSALCE